MNKETINQDKMNRLKRQKELLNKSKWSDADKLEYMLLSIEPYSWYWRIGMKKTLKKAIKLLKQPEMSKILKQSEVLEILKKHRLFGNIDVEESDIADEKGTHIEYELRYDFIRISIPEEEYKVLKEWLEENE